MKPLRQLIAKWESRIDLHRSVCEDTLFRTKADRAQNSHYAQALCSVVADLKAIAAPAASWRKDAVTEFVQWNNEQHPTGYIPNSRVGQYNQFIQQQIEVMARFAEWVKIYDPDQISSSILTLLVEQYAKGSKDALFAKMQQLQRDKHQALVAMFKSMFESMGLDDEYAQWSKEKSTINT